MKTVQKRRGGQAFDGVQTMQAGLGFGGPGLAFADCSSAMSAVNGKGGSDDGVVCDVVVRLVGSVSDRG